MFAVAVAVLGVVLLNGHVLTMSRQAPVATALAVVGDRIAYVGDDAAQARQAAGAGATELDLEGRTVIPGFDDAHVHFGLSITLGSADGVELPSVGRGPWLAALKKAAAERPPHRLNSDGWLFVQTRQLPPQIARASDLDFLDRPVFVVTERGGIANHRALRAARFTTREAPDGFVPGPLLPIALDRIVHSLPPRQLLEGARAFLATLAGLGITSVQLIDELPELFERLRLAGELTARVRLIPLGRRFDTRFYISSWRAVAPEWVRVDGIKYFHDDWARVGRYELREILEQNLRLARPVVMHILGRGPLSTFLDMVDSTTRARPVAAGLFRIEHADEVPAEEAKRLARLGVTVCANPSMLPEWRSATAFPARTLLDAGVALCFGSDWVGRHTPARPLSPVSALALAITHGGYGDKERIGAAEALRAYTLGSATAEGRGDLKGSLVRGKLADLAVLSADPTTSPPDQLTRIEVLLTMVGGRVVYRRSTFAATGAERAAPTSIGSPSPAQQSIHK